MKQSVRRSTCHAGEVAVIGMLAPTSGNYPSVAFGPAPGSRPAVARGRGTLTARTDLAHTTLCHGEPKKPAGVERLRWHREAVLGFPWGAGGSLVY